jgi:hypothetical protein
MLAGLDFLGARSITFTLDIIGGTDAAFAKAVDAVKTAFVPPKAVLSTAVLLPLMFQLPGQAQNRMVYCRCRKLDLPIDVSYSMDDGSAAVLLEAVDPRIYDVTLQSLLTSQPVMTGGLGFPLGPFPVGFGSVGSGGMIFATNAGNFNTRPVLGISGPCINPVVENRTAGQTLAFSITLGVGDTLTVDLNARSVLLNGPASRRNSMVSTPDQLWELAAATTSEIHFRTSDLTNTGATLSMSFRSAWL